MIFFSSCNRVFFSGSLNVRDFFFGGREHEVRLVGYKYICFQNHPPPPSPKVKCSTSKRSPFVFLLHTLQGNVSRFCACLLFIHGSAHVYYLFTVLRMSIIYSRFGACLLFINLCPLFGTGTVFHCF